MKINKIKEISLLYYFVIFLAYFLMMSTLKASTHPIIDFTSDEIADLKQKAITTHSDIWASILPKIIADDILLSPPPQCPTVNGDEIIYAARRLLSVAFGYVMTGNTNYAMHVKECLLAMAEWPYWGFDGGIEGGIDYGQCFMVYSNAVAYDWLYDYLTEEEREIIRSAIRIHGKRIYDAASIGYTVPEYYNWWRECYTGTHWIVNMSLFGTAALAMQDDIDEASEWALYVEDEVSKFSHNLNNMNEGTWHESTRYQDWRMEHAFIFYHNLFRIKGVDLIPHEFLNNLVLFRSHNYLQGFDRNIITHDDLLSFHLDGELAVMRFIASKNNNSYAEWLAQKFINERGRGAAFNIDHIYEFLYYNPNINPVSPLPEIPLNKTYPDIGCVLWRTGWGDNDVSFGLKSGAYGGYYMANAFKDKEYPWDSPTAEYHIGHTQPDANTFYLYKGSVDLSSERAGRLQSTAFHNTILVDGKDQYKDGTNPDRIWDAGQIQTVVNTESFNYLCSDATERYRYYREDPDGPYGIRYIDEFKRRVFFARPDYLVMVDNLKAPEKHMYEWVCHFGDLPSGISLDDIPDALSDRVSLEGKWIKGKSGNNNDILGVCVLSPSNFDHVIATNTDSYVLNETASKCYKPYIRVYPNQNVSNLRFISVLFPSTESDWWSKPKIKLLQNTDESCGIRVFKNGIQDYIFHYGSDNEINTDDYIFHGEAASIFKQSNILTKYFAINAKSLSDSQGTRVLFQSPFKQSFEANYYDNCISLFSENDLLGMTLFAPDVTEVTLNASPLLYVRNGDYITITNEDTESPTVPQDLDVFASYNEIKLTWSASTDNLKVKGYQIYKNDSLIADLDTLEYIDHNFLPGEENHYKVRSYDEIGNLSDFSNISIVQIQEIREPLAHYKFDGNVLDSGGNGYHGVMYGNPVYENACLSQGLRFDGVDDFVQVNWENPAIQGQDKSFTFSSWVKTESNEMQWILGELASYANIVFGFSVDSFSQTSLYIHWYDGVKRHTFFRNYRPKGKGFIHVAVTYDSETNFVSLYIDGVEVFSDRMSQPLGLRDITPMTIGCGKRDTNTQYFSGVIDDVRIYDVSLSNQEVLSIFRDYVFDSDIEIPETPQNFSGNVISDTQIDLSWNDAIDNVGVMQYKIYRNSIPVGTSIGTFFSDTGLKSSTTYSYYIEALDAAGNISNSSELITLTTDALEDSIPPTVPLNINGLAVSDRQINLTWDASTDNVSVKGYNIYRDSINIATVTATEFSDTGLLPSSQYTYCISAFDNEWNESAQSVSVTIETLEEVPTPPGLQAWFKFDGNVQDSSDNQYHGSSINTQEYSSDRNNFLDSALYFPGEKNSIVNVGDNINLATGDFTITLWFKADELTGTGTFVTKTTDSYYIDPDETGWFIGIREVNGMDKVAMHIRGTDDNLNIFTDEIDETIWHFLAIVKTESTIKLFIDDINYSYNKSVGNISAIGYDLLIGGHDTGYAYYKGALDDLRIYSYALSDSEISDLYNGTVTNYIPVIDSIEEKIIFEGEEIQFDVIVTDNDKQDIITLSSQNLPPFSTLTKTQDRTWQFTWQTDFTTNANSPYNINFTANDGTVNSDLVNVEIIVNDVNTDLNVTDHQEWIRE